MSPVGTAENIPGHGPGLAAPNREKSISEVEVPQDCILGIFSRPCGTGSSLESLPRTTPDFLYAAPDGSAYAAFFTESRMRLIDSTKPNRKSGYVLGYSQPSLRD